jgi:hypothetical protein
MKSVDEMFVINIEQFRPLNFPRNLVTKHNAIEPPRQRCTCIFPTIPCARDVLTWNFRCGCGALLTQPQLLIRRSSRKVVLCNDVEVFVADGTTFGSDLTMSIFCCKIDISLTLRYMEAEVTVWRR